MRRVRRLHRPPTLPVAFVLVAIALLVVLPGRAEPQEPTDPEQVRRGGALFAQYCTGCHGPQGEGGSGEGVLAGPPLDDIDLAYADLVIRTGRMPLVDRRAGVPREPDLDEDDRDAIVAWMADALDLEGQVPEVGEGDAPRGGILFNEHCASCHSTTGYGGVAGGGAVARSVRGLDDPVAIAAAARVGPFEMPSFSEEVLSDEDLADIAAALQEMDAERPSPLAITDVTHVTGTLFATVTVIVLLGLIVLIARMPRIAIAEEDRPWSDRDDASRADGDANVAGGGASGADDGPDPGDAAVRSDAGGAREGTSHPEEGGHDGG